MILEVINCFKLFLFGQIQFVIKQQYSKFQIGMRGVQDHQIEHQEKQPRQQIHHKVMSFEQEQQKVLQTLEPEQQQQQMKNIPSLLSQGQRSKIERRKKVNQYLNDRRNMGLVSNRRILGYIDEEQQYDGALINQLDNIEQFERAKSEAQLFILSFNKKPETAINQYITKGIIKDQSPESIAQYLIKTEGLDKQKLGQFFGKNNQKNLKILHQYCKHLNFNKVEFDQAIRHLLSLFRLPGQSQQIQRIIWEFAQVYAQLNKQSNFDPAQLHPLAYSIIMLSTDAHNPKQEKKMTKEEFIKNTSGPCPSFGSQYLSGIYDRIKKQKFQTEVSDIENIYAKISGISTDYIQIVKMMKQLKKGDAFLKICRNTNKFVQRKIYLSQDQQRIQWLCQPKSSDSEKPRYIQIKDITDLTLGLGSQVMKKNKVPPQFDPLCFTITTYYRTLDLKAKQNKQRIKWVNCIRSILIKRRQNKITQLQQQYKLNISREQIQEIWNTQIFPQWDQHWDYKKKKPKSKNVIVRGFQKVFSCMSKQGNEQKMQNQLQTQGQNLKSVKIKSSILQTLWSLGLPPSSRKILWPLVIGNNLVLNQPMLQQIKKRVNIQKSQLSKFKTFSPEVIQMAEFCRQFRPDLPAVRDILKISEVFNKAIPKTATTNPLTPLLNLLHIYHFLAFYRADMFEIENRTKLFQHFMSINVPKVKDHFEGLKLQTKMFLVSWFLSIFYDCFSENQQFLFRIWDNFLLQGQLYLYKVGISLIKYYEIQLTMCTFHQGLKILRFPKNTSPVLFFKILDSNIDVKQEHFNEYIEKRKNAIIKTRVQAIPLQ